MNRLLIPLLTYSIMNNICITLDKDSKNRLLENLIETKEDKLIRNLSDTLEFTIEYIIEESEYLIKDIINIINEYINDKITIHYNINWSGSSIILYFNHKGYPSLQYEKITLFTKDFLINNCLQICHNYGNKYAVCCTERWMESKQKINNYYADLSYINILFFANYYLKKKYGMENYFNNYIYSCPQKIMKIEENKYKVTSAEVEHFLSITEDIVVIHEPDIFECTIKIIKEIMNIVNLYFNNKKNKKRKRQD
jgi:hypothetical protein